MYTFPNFPSAEGVQLTQAGLAAIQEVSQLPSDPSAEYFPLDRLATSLAENAAAFAINMCTEPPDVEDRVQLVADTLSTFFQKNYEGSGAGAVCHDACWDQYEEEISWVTYRGKREDRS